MFKVYCARHGTRVLLWPDNVRALRNLADGVRLHWRCTCGETGVKRFSAGRGLTAVDS